MFILPSNVPKHQKLEDTENERSLALDCLQGEEDGWQDPRTDHLPGVEERNSSRSPHTSHVRNKHEGIEFHHLISNNRTLLSLDREISVPEEQTILHVGQHHQSVHILIIEWNNFDWFVGQQYSWDDLRTDFNYNILIISSDEYKIHKFLHQTI